VEPNRNREFQGEQVKIHKRGHKGATKLKSSFCFGDKMVSDDSILNLCLENTVGTPDSSSIQSENRSRSSYTADTLQKGCNSVDDSCSNTDVEESNTEFSLMNDTDNLTAVLEFNSQTYASIRIDAANLQSADSYPTQDISENLDEVSCQLALAGDDRHFNFRMKLLAIIHVNLPKRKKWVDG
jgi:hypothetical protein